MIAARSAAEPFFLQAGGRELFCLFHPAAGVCRGAVLYVHPFAEEMNRSRRIATLQAGALAALGYGVLQVDLHGCGDSSGEFGDARWDDWKEDLAAASGWLDARLGQRQILWGLRLGAALALDYARAASPAPVAVILWQPVQAGRAFLTQFLRLRMASQMLASSGEAQAGTGEMRAALARGETLEIAGYDLHPELARAIDAVELGALAPPAIPLHWFEVAAADRPLAPAAAGIVTRWRDAGVPVQVYQIPGQPFWSTPEIVECPALLAATSGVMRGLADAV